MLCNRSKPSFLFYAIGSDKAHDLQGLVKYERYGTKTASTVVIDDTVKCRYNFIASYLRKPICCYFVVDSAPLR